MKRLDSAVLWIMRKCKTFVRLENELAQMKRAHADYVGHLRKELQEEIEKTAQTADRVIKRCSEIRIGEKYHGRYVVAFEFDTRLLSSSTCTADEHSLIASRIGRMVEEEIARCKFVSHN